MSLEFLPGLVLGLREGLEAFLIIGIILNYIAHLGRQDLKPPVYLGLGAGIGGSVLIGFVLWFAVRYLHASRSATGKIWEAVATLAGLLLLSGFIYWMIRHGSSIVREVKGEVDLHLSRVGIFGLAAVMVLREGVEIALFAFASVSKNAYLSGISLGLAAAAVLALLIYRSLVKINLHLLFTITLAYLILQAGYLFGYGVHELLSALEELEILGPESPLFVRVYSFEGGILDHKTGLIGLPLTILVGWYSRPEWIQFLLQYVYTLTLGLFWAAGLRRKPGER